MCQFTQLYFQDDGYVVRCKDCGHYQLAFGTVMLTLQKEEFTKLVNACNRSLTADDLCAGQHVKSIYIPTPCAGMSLLLTNAELKQLTAMLDTADSEEKMLALMELFK